MRVRPAAALTGRLQQVLDPRLQMGCRRTADKRYELAPFHCPMPPVLPTERIAHLGTADCCIHPGCVRRLAHHSPSRSSRLRRRVRDRRAAQHRRSRRNRETGASGGGQNRAEQHPIPIHPSGSPSPPRAIQNKLLIAISESRRPRRNSVHYPVNAGPERHDRDHAAENFFQGGSPKTGHPISPPGPLHRQKSFYAKFPGMRPG
jgi:hypothetical protein